MLAWGIFATVHSVAASNLSASLVDVRMVWDKAPHNAFTDLKRFHDRWVLVFREATEHAVPKTQEGRGVIRVLTSGDGLAWESAAVLDAGVAYDLRDPHLVVIPNGKLALFAFRVDRAVGSYRSVLWVSPDGRRWAHERDVGDDDWPLWDVVTARDGTVYATAYGPILHPPVSTRLYESRDGLHFQYRSSFEVGRYATSEAALLLRRKGDAVALIREENRPGSTIAIGRGRPWAWSYKFTPVSVGGPALIELSTGEIIAGSRLTDGGTHTGLSLLDPREGTLTELIRFPGGGDTGYPGLVWFDNMLWVSYYATESGKSRIYLARVKLSAGAVHQAKSKPVQPRTTKGKSQPPNVDLLDHIRALQAQRTELLIRYTEAHPSVRQIESEINALKAKGGDSSP